MGATVLGLLVMPIAIAQYPKFFNANRWILPLSVAIVVVCWVMPFFLHERAKIIFDWILSLGTAGRGLALIVILAVLAGGSWGTKKLFEFHVHHLTTALAQSQSKRDHENTDTKTQPTASEIAEEVAKKLPLPKAPSRDPCLNKGLLEKYKSVCNVELGQWTIDEADKIGNMAQAALVNIYRELHRPEGEGMQGAIRFHFSEDFKRCCAQSVKDLRKEALYRLEPSVKDAEEQTDYEILFPEEGRYPLPQGDIAAGSVQRYSSYLRQFGVLLKQKAP